MSRGQSVQREESDDFFMVSTPLSPPLDSLPKADADDDDDDHGGSSLNCSTPGVAISLFRCVVFYELNTKAAKLACLKFWPGLPA